MSWLKIDDKFPRHRKVAPISDAAFRLHVTALAHCAEQMTDGEVTDIDLRVMPALPLGKKLRAAIRELVERGLWIEEGDHWRIHDYLDWNPSAEEQRAQQAAARERMRRRRSPDVRANTERTQGEHPENFERSSPSPSRPVPSRPVPELPGGSSSSSGAADSPPSKKPRKKPKRPLPPDLAICEKQLENTAKKGWPEWWVRDRFERFIEKAAASGWMYVDWWAAFFNFLRGEIDYKRGPEELKHLAPANGSGSQSPELQRRVAATQAAIQRADEERRKAARAQAGKAPPAGSREQREAISRLTGGIGGS